MTEFSSLGLAAPILKALEGEGYHTPTPIQAKAIPVILSGRDVLGIAQTGTGKSAAFALPILNRLHASPNRAPRRGCRALVLAPTRELASQIADSFRTYGRFMNITVTTVFGGVGHRPQVTALQRGVDVVVATPGRLLDHMGDGAIDLAPTEVFVLDEADQMLDLGFFPSIRRIVGKLPRQRQSLFFSATMPSEIGKLASELLTNPERVSVAPTAKPIEVIQQRVIHVEKAEKRALLVDLLKDAALDRVLVFTRTKRGADRVAEHLDRSGIVAAAIHGNKSQSQRERALDAFRDGKARVLVATDIAARGIDIDAVSHVVNFELPDVPESYVHRIGRTARAGASGNAITLCDREERGLLRDIERLTKQSIPAEDRRGNGSGGAPVSADRGDRNERSDRREWRPRTSNGHALRRDEAPRRAEEREHRRPRDGGRRNGHAPRQDQGQRQAGEREHRRPREGGERNGQAPRADQAPRLAGEREHRRPREGGERNGHAPRADQGPRQAGEREHRRPREQGERGSLHRRPHPRPEARPAHKPVAYGDRRGT